MARYKKLYGINLDDLSPYTLIVHADEKDEGEVFNLVSDELPVNNMAADEWIFDPKARTNPSFGCKPEARSCKTSWTVELS